jgi:hypothetical protein
MIHVEVFPALDLVLYHPNQKRRGTAYQAPLRQGAGQSDISGVRIAILHLRPNVSTRQ